MSDDLNMTARALDGNVGTQGDFLDRCWELAFPGASGTRRNAKSQDGADSSERSRVPARSQEGRERNLPQNSGDSGLRSRVPGESEHDNNSDDWAGDARRLIDALPDESLRVLLYDHFEESAATLEYEQGLTRQAAEQAAFGQILYQLLRRGLDVGVPR
jgi:hypothetical protein